MPEQIIMKVTGHRSTDGVRTYKKVAKEQLQDVSNRPLAVGVAQHFRSAILEYNLPCIVIEAYECFDAYSLSGLQMYMLFQYMITQAVLYKITERKY